MMMEEEEEEGEEEEGKEGKEGEGFCGTFRKKKTTCCSI